MDNSRNDASIAIVGAGMAGMASAVRACELGLKPRIFEARSEPHYPCNTRWSGGVFHLAFRSMRSDPDELAAAIITYTRGFVRPEIASALAGNAARSIDWLESHGIEFGSIEPTEGWRDLILAPLGYHDRTRLQWKGLGADRLLDRLEQILSAKGVSIERGRRVESLLIEDGHCRGVRLQNGEQLRSAATLLADGGFQGNPELLRRYVTPFPERLRQRGPGTSPGDGIRMATEAGGEMVHMETIYAHMLSVDAMHNDELWPFPFLDFLAASGVLIDRNGLRFADEGRGGVYMTNQIVRHEAASPYFAIFDEEIWAEAGRHFFAPPNPNLIRAGGTLHRADDLSTLAQRAGLPSGQLLDTVAKHNAALISNDFSTLAPARSNAKNNARPIKTPPFYAAPGCPAITHTMGGVRVDPQARVLRPDGSAIRGLLAAGNVTGGMEGGDIAAYVGGLARALIFGLLAAETVAENDKGATT